MSAVTTLQLFSMPANPSQTLSATSSSPTSLPDESTSLAPQPSASDVHAHEQSGSHPAAAIAGVIVALVLVLTAGLIYYLFVRRRRQRAGAMERPRDSSVELGSKEDYWSPVVDKSYPPDPFMTDAEARSLGLDLERQSTLRMEAKFAVVDPAQVESSISRPGSAASRKILATSSRSVTPDVYRSPLAISNGNDPQRSTTSLLPRSGTDVTSASGAVSRGALTSIPQNDNVSIHPQPNMRDLIVQLGLDADQRPVTPSKILPRRTLLVTH